MRIHHVQVMIARGREDEALAFYAEVLGLQRIPKPADMPNPEGLWFALEGGELHLGVQDEAPPASRAHVALEVEDWSAAVERLRAAGARVEPSQPVAGLRRAHVWDPFGNRLELLGT